MPKGIKNHGLVKNELDELDKGGASVGIETLNSLAYLFMFGGGIPPVIIENNMPTR